MSRKKLDMKKIVGKSKNVKVVKAKTIKKVPKDKNLFLAITHPGCGHCKGEIEQAIKPVCKNLKNTKCLIVDASKKESLGLQQQLGLKGYPTNIFCSTDGKSANCTKIEGAVDPQLFKAILREKKMD